MGWIWTPEADAELRRLIADGKSSTPCAEALSVKFMIPVTRNMVIGRATRIGAKLPGRPAGLARRVPAKPPVKALPAPAPVLPPPRRAPAFERYEQPETYVEPKEEIVIPLSQRVTLMELRPSMCRWPMGDPKTSEFRFCGAAKGAGSYCDHHASIAYEPASARRRHDAAVRRGIAWSR